MIKLILFTLLLITSNLYAQFAVKSYQELRNEQVIRQSYEESCGAASLATLINILNFKALGEEDIIKLMSEKDKKPNTDMVSFLELSQTATKLSYESKGYQIDRSIFEKITIPILVKIEDDSRYPHFVIVINHQGNFITILDPSYGKYVSTKEQFYNLWDKHKRVDMS